MCMSRVCWNLLMILEAKKFRPISAQYAKKLIVCRAQKSGKCHIDFGYPLRKNALTSRCLLRSGSNSQQNYIGTYFTHFWSQIQKFSSDPPTLKALNLRVSVSSWKILNSSFFFIGILISVFSFFLLFIFFLFLVLFGLWTFLSALGTFLQNFQFWTFGARFRLRSLLFFLFFIFFLFLFWTCLRID